MRTKDTIEHMGIIKSIDDYQINVSVIAMSACASCHAKGACSVSDMQEKLIEIKNPPTGFSVGEKVKIVMKQALGFRALFLGYILPFLIVLISLFVFVEITGSEGKGAIIALGLLIPYYLILYLKKDKLSKTFSFNIEKQQ